MHVYRHSDSIIPNWESWSSVRGITIAAFMNKGDLWTMPKSIVSRSGVPITARGKSYFLYQSGDCFFIDIQVGGRSASIFVAADKVDQFLAKRMAASNRAVLRLSDHSLYDIFPRLAALKLAQELER